MPSLEKHEVWAIGGDFLAFGWQRLRVCWRSLRYCVFRVGLERDLDFGACLEGYSLAGG
jgi:hypothetical protein